MTKRGVVTGLAVLAAALASAQPALAQAGPRASVVGGYAYLRELSTSNLPVAVYEVGWAAAGGIRFGTSRWSAAGETGVSMHQTEFDERQQVFSVLGGARWDILRRTRMTLFAQGLAGMERFSEPGYSVWGVAVQPGAGVDIRLGSKMIARVQADYRFTSEDGATFHALRIFAGAGVTFGR